MREGVHACRIVRETDDCDVWSAIQLDGCDVRGYTLWSLMDNFEWGHGYTEKFGLYYVNFSDPLRHRVPKDSVRFYKDVITSNGLPPSPSPASATLIG